ncbi:DUF6509 family protein [Paenibacillus sp. UNC499MF]|uniref:DUF6509 family protein n=1 Tax=Paenibacillus sp. UNC499MF TaxID=1502751 RepID=UPI0008A0554B|nr:DUF6509 family protein [Paenibacillus sp. UNC499MF]SEF68061.1 hypothetical protein SAMN02799616_00852 [Paenibacillus sp. UNC499MF]
MLTITAYSAELVKDPFGIIPGKRYEFNLEVDVPEDDELYTANGIYLRVIYGVDENQSRIIKYDIHENSTDAYLEFDLEDEELAVVDTFCREHLPQDE